MISVTVTTTIPTPMELGRRLSDAERKVLTAYKSKIHKHYQDAWVGWIYKGRPDGDPRFVSRDAWRSRVDSTENGPRLIIDNRAEGYKSGKPYSAYIHRSGSSEREWLVLAQAAEKEIVPLMVRDLTAAIIAALEKPGRTRKIRDGASERLTLNVTL